MDTAILYYSYSGTTKRLAETLAKETPADLFQLTPRKWHGMLLTLLTGVPAAWRQKPAELTESGFDLSGYTRIILAAPIWGGSPAPAFYSAVTLLPKGKSVEAVLTSGSGSSSKEESVRRLLESRGCTLNGYRNVKAGSI